MKNLKSPILWLLVFSLFARLILSPFGTLRLDMGSWMGWSNRLATVPLPHFYDQWSDYLPGYLYVLLALGKVSLAVGSSDTLYKLPGIFSDVAAGALIYWILRTKSKNKKLAFLGSAAYLGNPAVWSNSALWGQVDGLSGLILVLALAFLLSSQISFAAAVVVLGLIVKPQIALVWPIVGLVALRERKIPQLLAGSVLAAILVILSFIPFAGQTPLWQFIPSRFAQSFNQYPYTSLNAFNLWGVSGSGWWWIGDGSHIPLVAITPQLLGFGLFIILALVILRRLFRQSQPKFILLVLAVTLFQLMAFYFLTRVHERHLLPVIAPLTLAASLIGSSQIWLILAILSFTYVANLLYAFVWITQSFTQVFPPLFIAIFSIANGVGLVLLLAEFLNKQPRFVTTISQTLKSLLSPLLTGRVHSVKLAVPEVPFIRRHWRIILLATLIFSAVVRFARLDIPNTYMFDEVYHAFTAREMLVGNKAAWEWWNTPPAGFAYEWSHPPLAKELMVGGLKLIADSSFGWRVPGALLGTLCVLFIFLIVWEIFHNPTLAVLSALIFALDNLPLAMSRIGMNDIYFLFFTLVAFWLLLKERFLLFGLCFGFALASKWTALYFYGVVFFVFVQQRYFADFKKAFKLALGAFVLAPAIYMLSYLPFFTWGHTLTQFIELQKQMWWYHTGLKATHPYESQWWTWPLMLRPVWFYVDYGKTVIANIYARGNPLFYWLGIPSTMLALFYTFKFRESRLSLILYSYLIFFLPWAFSPRIMFLYHFLPATPYLSVIVAWFILTTSRQFGHKWVYLSLLAIFLSFLFFFPNTTAIPIPINFDKIFYWLPSWK